ncbi:MAG TPA: PrsW family intramembrane metalloprotease [Chloroflexota bacterium]|nr:PrsW family intramembrane metalloprotease [Chloroflexota bacterium]
MQCERCGNDVPEGAFCTRCGAQQGLPAGDAGLRLGHFAAHPGEHVLHPGILSTLLPHASHEKVHEFRYALLAGIAGIFVLYIAGLISAAVLVAAFLIPLLYLLYLYEAQIYRDEPLPVLGLTFGGGIILGIIVTSLTDYFSPAAAGLPNRESAGVTVMLFIVVPIIQAIVKPLPALPLRTRPQFRETVDGLVFGVAAGLGFSISETLIRYSSVIGHLPLQTSPGDWIYPLLTLAILRPLMQGSTAGAVTAGLWRLWRGRVTTPAIMAILAGIAGEVAFIYGSQLFVDRGFSAVTILAWQVLIVGLLTLFIRYLLHHALLEEAAHMGYAETVCPNCRHRVMASGFCPRCGKALTAGPGVSKHGQAVGARPAAPEGR